jgi:hypothetical protein
MYSNLLRPPKPQFSPSAGFLDIIFIAISGYSSLLVLYSVH